jgi:predicted RNase H-like nuclease (RuvC/YqgF family)
MNTDAIVASIVVLVVSVAITYFISKRKADKQITEYRSLTQALFRTKQELSSTQAALAQATAAHANIDAETKGLQALKSEEAKLTKEVEERSNELASLSNGIAAKSDELLAVNQAVVEARGTLDLYTRIEDFVAVGHFELPEYLHDTSERFSEEIKQVREQQKELIKSGGAVIVSESFAIFPDAAFNKRLMTGQMKLVLAAFNIECDFMIGKVSPSNFGRTLERIEKLANTLEKSVANLHCGIDSEYVELKYKECTLQYQYKLKKQEEQEEQRQIREQIREEQKAIKEYERAVAEAEKEERLYREMLQRAREELNEASDETRMAAEQRIADLERQLAEAEAKEQRAKSMAEQTRKGHVYVISNIGSFGHDVYKIGLTRRLDPLDRVKELGDASVPFSFDVHAMIYVDDAPALESALHREFSNVRVNAVNLRKEFFRADLEAIKQAVEKIAGVEADFKTTIAAEEYYETRRLQSVPRPTPQRSSESLQLESA